MLRSCISLAVSCAMLLVACNGSSGAEDSDSLFEQRNGYRITIDLTEMAPPPSEIEDVAAVTSDLDKYEPADLFRGLVLGYGPVAEAIPAIRDNTAISIRVADPKVREMVIASCEKVVAVILTEHNAFLKQFAEDVLSRDHQQIADALRDGTMLAVQVADDLEMLPDNGDPTRAQGMGIVLFAAVVLFVVAHNQVAINAAVFATLAIKVAVARQKAIFEENAVTDGDMMPEQDKVPVNGNPQPLLSATVIDQVATRPVPLWSFRSGLTYETDTRYTSDRFGLVAGDFSGDGLADRFYFEPLGNGCGFSFGDRAYFDCAGFALVQPTGGKPVVGDFDNNGHDDLYWRFANGHQETWYFSNEGNGLLGMEIKFWTRQDSGSNHHVVVGDFDGDARDDIFWYGRGSVSDAVLFGLANRTFQTFAVSVSGTEYLPVVGDFMGDHPVDDIIWYNNGEILHPTWELKRTNNQTLSIRRSFDTRTKSSSYRPVVADFDQNGYDDIFWHISGDPVDTMWLHNGTGYTTKNFNLLSNYFPVAAELTGDAGRYPDIIWWANSHKNFPQP